MCFSFFTWEIPVCAEHWQIAVLSKTLYLYFLLQNVPSPSPLSPAVGAKRREKHFLPLSVPGHQTAIDQNSAFSFYPRRLIIPCGFNPNSKLPYSNREQQHFLRPIPNLLPPALPTLIFIDVRVYFTVISNGDD